MFAPLDFEILLHVLADLLDRATWVRSHLFDDQVPVVAAHVVKEHRHVIDDFALQFAKVVRCTNVVAGNVVVVVHLAPVGVLTIKQTIDAAADAADSCFMVTVTLRLCHISHRQVRLHVFDALVL